MLEAGFCYQTSLPTLCDWIWKVAVTLVVVFLGWKLISPKKEEF